MAHAASLLVAIALAALAGAAARAELQQAGGGRRKLSAVRDVRGGAPAVRVGMPLAEAAAARLCVLQCLQHSCIGWHKVYMGEAAGASSLQPAAAVPAAAAECMLACGMPEVEAGCVSQTYQRLLNTSPLQYSCSSGCVTGLLHSACGQCGGTGGGCGALQLSASSAPAECLVDAAV